MDSLYQTLATPADNLALDEALLEWAEEEGPLWEFLRVWESPEPMVVVGRSSRVEEEVNVATCVERGIPILRRSSGGAAIVTGPGCLMVAVVLSYERRPELRDIHQAHQFVLGRLLEGIRPLVPSVQQKGTSDLVFLAEETEGSAIRKFSGNSLRAKRTHLLYHGTLLYDFDLAQITRCLSMPPRQPEYREARPHTDFVANLPLSKERLLEALASAWPDQNPLANWPRERVDHLVRQRFGRIEWNLSGEERSTSL